MPICLLSVHTTSRRALEGVAPLSFGWVHTSLVLRLKVDVTAQNLVWKRSGRIRVEEGGRLTHHIMLAPYTLSRGGLSTRF